MQTKSTEQLATEVHASGRRLVLVVTGGGSGAIPSLLDVAGASRSVLAAAVPYAPAALAEWLGSEPEVYCSARTARAMAMAAYLRAGAYDSKSTVCGVACTASLASDRPKRGPHRIHAAYQTADTTSEVSLELEKGQRTRAEEENVSGEILLNLVAEACGVSARIDAPLLSSERLLAQRVTAPPEQQALLSGKLQGVAIQTIAGKPPDQAQLPRAVLPGAFNPLHQAHRRMAEIAGQLLSVPVAYELSILNVDKPPLDFIEIQQRARQFSSGESLWLSRASHFTQKADLFPGATFVVGADTVARVGDTRYYAHDEAKMAAAIDHLARQGCRFLVFGRVSGDVFRSLEDLRLPPALAALCREVPQSQFRDDISSTQLRRQAGTH